MAKTIERIKLEFVEGAEELRLESFYGGSMEFQGFGMVWQRLEKS